MSDAAILLDQVEEAQAEKETTINELVDALSPSSFGGRRSLLGLTWGYYGGRWDGAVVPHGAFDLPASATSRIVADRATGEIILDTASDDLWADQAHFAHLYQITTGATGIPESGIADHRQGPAGLYGSAGSGSALTDGDYGDVIVSGAGTVLTIDPTVLSSAARALLNDVDAATMRTTLGLVIGTNVQAFDADLAAIAALPATTDSFIQAKAGAWTARTIAQVVADLQGDGLTATLAGFRGIPQNSQSAAYTLVASDAGKHIYHPAADATARIWTIPANASVAFPIGTAVTFDNDFGAGAITIAITTDTLVLVGTAGSTGSRTLAPGGQATAVKVTATRWRISGTGVS